ncbi:branched-chain amino acid ABC transporter permease [Variovorax sp. EL159]|uniref:branched-chain amino acid ABC transporter permease n=1 Tax=Variovorax sp. EL159 TaxID=1566270 RepID=UPI0008887482|nr:branched-chain amino acid ABC transporter permease [Variovorax sp. EL159]SCX72577.1 amino acid/amide ABC transporter membrane protein 1, HAAT family (TC 3.A.1.4.-) [Variovorax sp. EL159]
MEAFLFQVFSGLATGCVYALIALALVMVHKSSKLANFAQAEIATFSTFIAWACMTAGASYAVSAALTLLSSFAIGYAINALLLQRLQDRRTPEISVLMVLVGLLMLFHSLSGSLFGYKVQTFPSPLPKVSYLGGLVTAHQLGIYGVTAAIMLALYLFFSHTDIGLKMRAAAASPDSARLTGISVRHMASLGWGIATVIGAIAGMMIAPILYLDPLMMTSMLIYGFTAALLGGIDHPKGAIVGGLLVGVGENLLGAYVIGTELKLTVANLLIIGILLFRPAGIFGKPGVSRV